MAFSLTGARGTTLVLLLVCALAAAAACSSGGSADTLSGNGMGNGYTSGTGATAGGDGGSGGSGQTGSGQTGSGQSGSGQTGSGQTGSGQGGSGMDGGGMGTGTGAGTGMDGSTSTGTGGGAEDGGLADGGNLDLESNPFFNLLTGPAQLKALCARNNGDAVSKAFCTPATPPTVTSLVDLQKLLGLDFKAGNVNNGRNGNPAFVLSGNSSSLVARFTSAINPRALIFTPPNKTGRVGNNGTPLASFVAMGFVRGEQFVELVSNDPTANNALRFFLFQFQHACDATPQGCVPGDLLTPAVESNFTGVYTLYQEDDIKDTMFDCQQCHQNGGPTTQKILRQQELQNPWGHWFRNNRVNGQVLIADYQAAHGTAETYAGIPGGAIDNSDPAQLEGLVEGQGFVNQPNEYTTAQILKEVQAVNPNQPASNVPAGTSATWEKLYQNAQQSLDIAPPYHDIKITDPTKLQTMTTAYQAFLGGTMPAAQLPDIRQVFLDSALPDLTFQPAAGLTGSQILVQICQQCHNSKLDQTETRERFRVDQLDQMSTAEKQLAIHRLTLPADSFRLMPPKRFRELNADQIQLVTQALSQ